MTVIEYCIVFVKECSELANKRKQTKLLWLQSPNNQTAEDFSNVRRDTCRIIGIGL